MAAQYRQMYGATNQKTAEAICAARSVEIDTGKVAGLFHMANGSHAECAAQADLVAEGW
jgi:hypothetical protein